MDIKEIEKRIIDSVVDVLKMAGHHVPKITLETIPLQDISGFDSLMALSAINSFEEKTGKNLPDINDLFFSDGKDKIPNLKQVAKRIHVYLNEKGEGND